MENNYYDHIEIYNSNGISVWKNDLSKNIQVNPIAIDIAALPQGVYLIKLLQNRNSIQKVFVKN